MVATATIERAVELRRELHRHPEPAWREFYTTARLVTELRARGVDELYIGDEAIDADARLELPDDADVYEQWRERAVAAGADPDIVDQLGDGRTGLVAVVDRGPGPTVGLRVDIDGLFQDEADDPGHAPAAAGFRSENTGVMHACGHDGHAAIGVGVIDSILDSDFSGTLKVFFQPAEEEVAGGRALVEGGHLDDVDYLFAVHLGLGHPTGEIVAGIDGFLAVTNLEVTFTGESAHAGGHPEEGRNAIQALGTAIQNLYAIPRHADGATRVNVGRLQGGTAGNVIAQSARFVGEVRGETTALREYMRERAIEVIAAAAAMHGCEHEITFGAEAPTARSDRELAAVVASAAEGMAGVDSVLDRDTLDGSEDATYLMERVQERGGMATYVIVGTDHPGGHHAADFDVDEASIGIGIELFTEAIRHVAREQPG